MKFLADELLDQHTKEHEFQGIVDVNYDSIKVNCSVCGEILIHVDVIEPEVIDDRIHA